MIRDAAIIFGALFTMIVLSALSVHASPVIVYDKGVDRAAINANLAHIDAKYFNVVRSIEFHSTPSNTWRGYARWRNDGWNHIDIYVNDGYTIAHEIGHVYAASIGEQLSGPQPETSPNEAIADKYAAEMWRE